MLPHLKNIARIVKLPYQLNRAKKGLIERGKYHNSERERLYFRYLPIVGIDISANPPSPIVVKA